MEKDNEQLLRDHTRSGVEPEIRCKDCNRYHSFNFFDLVLH